MSQTMPALVHHTLAPGGVELRDYPRPEIGPEDVLLAVRGVSVCGSDVHQYHNTHSWRVNVPVVLGHEFGGEVARAGGVVKAFHEGDRVVSETAAVICGACLYCRAGEYNLCPQRLGFGYGVDGAMAQFVRVPARCLHLLPATVPFEKAALTEPCCVAYNAVVVKSRIRPGDTVAVIGPGPIGLLCLQMARLANPGLLALVGLEEDRPRLQMALRRGADAVLTAKPAQGAGVEPAQGAGGRPPVPCAGSVQPASASALVLAQSPLEWVRSVGDGLGAHLVVDAAGVSETLRLSLELVRPGGQITKVGWGPKPLGFSLDALVQKAVTLQGAFSHTYRTWEAVLGLLARAALDLELLIGTVEPLQNWQRAFNGMHERKIIKAVLVP